TGAVRRSSTVSPPTVPHHTQRRGVTSTVVSVATAAWVSGTRRIKHDPAPPGRSTTTCPHSVSPPRPTTLPSAAAEPPARAQSTMQRDHSHTPEPVAVNAATHRTALPAREVPRRAGHAIPPPPNRRTGSVRHYRSPGPHRNVPRARQSRPPGRHPTRCQQ